MPFLSLTRDQPRKKRKVKPEAQKSGDAYFLKAPPLKAISNIVIYSHSISGVKEKKNRHRNTSI
jgi:hypothetical protein